MQKKYFHTNLDSPVGVLYLTSNDTALVSVHFSDHQVENSLHLPDILIRTTQQLKEYFEGTRFTFNLKLAPEGSEFQQNVWNQVLQIPYGKTATYLEIARLTGSAKNTRAVGLANSKNPIPIVIPCHRIIGSDGKLTGYAGGIERKRWLLQHELNYYKPVDRLF